MALGPLLAAAAVGLDPVDLAAAVVAALAAAVALADGAGVAARNTEAVAVRNKDLVVHLVDHQRVAVAVVAAAASLPSYQPASLPAVAG